MKSCEDAEDISPHPFFEKMKLFEDPSGLMGNRQGKEEKE